MKTKILSFGAAVPLFVLGAVNLASPASAAVFNAGDLFSADVSVRLGNVGGAAGTGIDFFFAPASGGNGFDEAPINSLADFAVDTLGNTGAFSAFNTGGVTFLGDAQVRSFNPITSAPIIGALDLDNNNFFSRIQIDAANSTTGSAVDYLLSLDSSKILRSDVAVVGTDALGRTLLSTDFSVLGQIQDQNSPDPTNPEIVDVRYDFSIPSLAVVSGAGTPADPFTTDRVAQAATVRIEAIDVPESSGVNTLLGLGSLGLIAGLASRSRSRNLSNKLS